MNFGSTRFDAIKILIGSFRNKGPRAKTKHRRFIFWSAAEKKKREKNYDRNKQEGWGGMGRNDKFWQKYLQVRSLTCNEQNHA